MIKSHTTRSFQEYFSQTPSKQLTSTPNKTSLAASFALAHKTMPKILSLCTLTYWHENANNLPTELLRDLKNQNFLDPESQDLDKESNVRLLCEKLISLMKKPNSEKIYVPDCFFYQLTPSQLKTINISAIKIKMLLRSRLNVSENTLFPESRAASPLPLFEELSKSTEELKETITPRCESGIATLIREDNLQTLFRAAAHHLAPPNKPPLYPLSFDQKKPSSILLDTLKKSPLTSQFITEDSLSSTTRTVRKTEEAILRFSSSFANKEFLIYALYHLCKKNSISANSCLNNHQLCQEIKDLIPLSSLEGFELKYDKIPLEKTKNTSQILIKKLKIEHIAAIKVIIDFIHIARSLTQKNEFYLNDLVVGYTTQSSLWLETHKDLLEEKKSLDLSKTFIQTIPEKLIPYLPNVRKVNFSHNNSSQPPLNAIQNLLTLPNLENLNLSCNAISYFPLYLLDNAKQLKHLNLSGNTFSKMDQDSISLGCQTRGIEALF